jgi:type II secretory pathway pseudopilin PulG
MSTPSAARFCPTCGQALPGPVPHCPRCGAHVGAAVGVQKKSNTALVIIIVLVAVFGGVSCLGILAAIAIPNFVRYQLRAKQSQVTLELGGLAKAEQAVSAETGKFIAIQGMPAAQAGSVKASFTAEELASASALGWSLEGTTYGQYRVAVVEEAGVQAASLCGESDIDGDGERAAFVVFLPGDGVAPPPAPCTEPVAWTSQYAAGEVVRVTGPSTF